jgi:transcriptional regulator with XRE-family HTH domain
MAPVYTPAYQRMLVRLRLAREHAGLTQAVVAAHFGRPQSFVSKVEHGERRIDPPELQAFAALYGKSVEYFLTEIA